MYLGLYYVNTPFFAIDFLLISIMSGSNLT